MIRSCSGELYRVLGVEKGANDNEVKRAYRRKALLVHPDRTGGQTTLEFQQLQEAESIIGDPKMRKVYDTFGRKGVQATRMGMDADAMAMFQNGGILRAAIFLIWLMFVMHVIFLSLVLAKIDQPKPTWSWVAVFTPVWIDLALIIPSACAGLIKGALGLRVGVVLTSIRALALCVAAILFARSLDGATEWKGAFGMLLCAMLIGAIGTINSLRPSQIKESLVLGGRPADAENFTIFSVVFASRVFAAVSGIILPMAFVCALFGNIVHNNQVNYYGIFSPLYILLVVRMIPAVYEILVNQEFGCGAKVCAIISSSFSMLACMYTVVMISVKCQKELLEASSGPSAAVCCIPVIIALAIPVLGLCCACCAPMPTGMPDDETDYQPAADGGEEGGPEYTPAAHDDEPIVVPTERSPLQALD